MQKLLNDPANFVDETLEGIQHGRNENRNSRDPDSGPR